MKKTIEELQAFLKEEMQVARYCQLTAAGSGEYVLALESQQIADTYAFLLEWLEGKCT